MEIIHTYNVTLFAQFLFINFIFDDARLYYTILCSRPVLQESQPTCSQLQIAGTTILIGSTIGF